MSKSSTNDGTKRPKKYRKNVAAVVLNKQGRILICRRSDVYKAWQLPQGGIDKGETPRQALLRELYEEIGTNKVQIIGRLREPIRYEWPPELFERGYRGQEQIYFLVRIAPGEDIPLEHTESKEFDKMKWVTASRFIKKVDGFKAEAYSKALNLLSEQFPETILE
jgi:putative (di)nucleoside polyphosphate hydrolase